MSAKPTGVEVPPTQKSTLRRTVNCGIDLQHLCARLLVHNRQQVGGMCVSCEL